MCALNEAHYVAHAEYSVGHARWVEHVDGFHFLAGSDELDGLRHHGAYAYGRTAASVAVELGEHNAVEVQAVVEFLGRVDGVLSGHGVYDEQCLVGIDGVFQRLNLVHHLFVHSQSAGSVYYHHVMALGFRFLYGVLGYGHNVLAFRLGVYGYAYL